MTEQLVSIRQMRDADLEQADKIMRLSFGTYLGLPDPMQFMGDADYVKTRFNADPSGALVAEDSSGKIVGSNFAMNWGSVGVFGPLTTHPDTWDKGFAKQLLEETMKIFSRWGSRHLGLFTFAQSAKHVHLYQKFGFWPRYLTAVMYRNLSGSSQKNQKYYARLLSQLSQTEKENATEKCRQLSNQIFEGLDLRKEIRSVDVQKLGDTVLMLDSGDNLAGFAICHTGAGTEAGTGNCYVKFGAVNRDDSSGQLFSGLLDCVQEFALSKQTARLVAGVNMARHGAYKIMIERGFRTELQGVAMHSPNAPGYNLPDIYLIDDWR